MVTRSASQRTQHEQAAAIVFVVMWSSGFVGARFATDQAGTLTVLSWRFIAAVAVIGAWWLLRHRRRLRPRAIAVQAVVGLLAQGIYLAAVFAAVELGVSAGTAALITALQPILAGAIAASYLDESTSTTQWAGLVLGIVGVALVVSGDVRVATGAPLWAYLLPVASVVALTAATVVTRKAATETSVGETLLIHCASAALFFTALAASAGQLTPPQEPRFWLAVVWLVFLSTIGGYGFYWMNLRIGSVTRVSSLIYLTPPTTMLWGFIMFGEVMTLIAVVGLTVCAIAVLMVRQTRGTGAHQSRTSPLLRR